MKYTKFLFVFSFIFVIGLLSFISKPDKKNLTDKNIDFLNQTNPKKAFNGNSFLIKYFFFFFFEHIEKLYMLYQIDFLIYPKILLHPLYFQINHQQI